MKNTKSKTNTNLSWGYVAMALAYYHSKNHSKHSRARIARKKDIESSQANRIVG